MARITVYKGKPLLTLLSWFGMACILLGVLQILDKKITTAYFLVLMGWFLVVLAGRRAAGRKMRITGKTAAIWLFAYYVASLVQKILDEGLAGVFTFSDWTALLVIAKVLVGIVLAVLLLLPAIKNKPAAAAYSCFALLALNLYTCIQLLTAEAHVYVYILLAMLLFPVIPGLILLLRGRKMTDDEKRLYVF